MISYKIAKNLTQSIYAVVSHVVDVAEYIINISFCIFIIR